MGMVSQPIRVSPKSFNTDYFFKKGGTLSMKNFLKLKKRNKLSRLVPLGFNHKDLRANPFKLWQFHTEQEQGSLLKLNRFIIQLLVVDYIKETF